MAAGRNSDWGRDEHILAFNLYCKIPFGRIHANNAQIVGLAKLLGRSANAVSLKLSNFARLDPELRARGIKGMRHGAKGEQEIWRQFEDDPEALAFESERLLAKLTGQRLEEFADIDEHELPREGLERERMLRVRVNQRFFRTTVLSAYDYKCCVTDLAVPELLVASHIVPWAREPKQRMNPRNGLSLNALHDRAFDRGLMFIDKNMTVRFREKLIRSENEPASLHWLLSYEGRPICMPRKFKPDPDLLSAHSSFANAVHSGATNANPAA